MKFLNSEDLLDVLLKYKILTPKQRQFVILEKGKQRQKLQRQASKKGKVDKSYPDMVDILVAFNLKVQKGKDRLLDEELIMRAVAKDRDLPFKKLDPLELDMEVVTKTIPRNFAIRQLILPFKVEEGVLDVAIYHPDNDVAIADIEVVSVEVRPNDDGAFGVPVVELKTRVVWRSLSGGVPVMTRPVARTAPEIGEHVGDEVVDVNMVDVRRIVRTVRVVALELLILHVVRQTDPNLVDHGVPRGGVALACGRPVMNGVPIFLLAPEIIRRERSVRAFDWIIQPPVQPVDVQVYERSVRPRLAEGQLGVSHVLIDNILRVGLAPVVPTIV